MIGYRRTLRSRPERMWVGLITAGMLGGLGLLLLTEWALPGVQWPAAFWQRDLAYLPPLPVLGGLYGAGALGVLWDLAVPLRPTWRNVVWHWAIALLLTVTVWVGQAGFPTAVLAYGWVPLVTLLSIWWEPRDRPGG